MPVSTGGNFSFTVSGSFDSESMFLLLVCCGLFLNIGHGLVAFVCATESSGNRKKGNKAEITMNFKTNNISPFFHENAPCRRFCVIKLISRDLN